MTGDREYSEPFLGRAPELARASASLDAGIGVVVAGPEGSGRSRFARELAATVDPELRARLRVGDDLARLRDEDVERWAAAVRSGAIVPIATASFRRSHPAIDELVRHKLLSSIVLGPLSARELQAIVEYDLGGRLAPTAVAELVPARGGDDIVALRETVAEAVQTGALVEHSGLWAVGEHGIRSDSARRRAFTRSGADIRLDSAEAEDIMDLLSLAPGLELRNAEAALAALERLPSAVEAAIELLEAFGYVSVERTSTRLQLTVRDGVDELLMPHGIGVFRRYRLANALVEVLSGSDAPRLSPAETISRARHGIDLGAPIAAEVLVAAARASLRTPRIVESLTFAAAAIDAGGGFEAELAMADAEARAGRNDEALERLVRLHTLETDDEKRARTLHSMSDYARDRSRRAAEVLDGEFLSRSSLSAERRDVLRGFRLYNLGRVVEAADLIKPALPSLTGLERAEGLFQVGVMELMLGHISDAAAALDESERSYLAEDADASHVHFVRANVNILRGRAAETLAVTRAIRDQVAAFGQPVAQAYIGWAIGTLIMACGSLTEAARELESSVDVLESAGIDRAGEVVRLDLALCLAQAGEGEKARRAVRRSSEHDDGSEPAVSGKTLLVEGWTWLSEGNREHARSTFLRAADVYASGGFFLPSLSALLDAARVGRPEELADRILALAAGMEGDYIDLVRLLIAALAAETSARSRPDGADAVAALFESAGAAAARIDNHLVAAEAFDRASSLYELSGAGRAAAAAARMRDEHLAACGLARTPSGVTGRSSVLSEREYEIASLAASGASNREIAAALVLSVRTVETHLQRVYIKVGVRRRAELGEALRGAGHHSAGSIPSRG